MISLVPCDGFHYLDRYLDVLIDVDDLSLGKIKDML